MWTTVNGLMQACRGFMRGRIGEVGGIWCCIVFGGQFERKRTVRYFEALKVKGDLFIKFNLFFFAFFYFSCKSLWVLLFILRIFQVISCWGASVGIFLEGSLYRLRFANLLA